MLFPGIDRDLSEQQYLFCSPLMSFFRERLIPSSDHQKHRDQSCIGSSQVQNYGSDSVKRHVILSIGSLTARTQPHEARSRLLQSKWLTVFAEALLSRLPV